MNSSQNLNKALYSKDSEMMVLGCMLTSDNSLNVAADALEDSDFYFTEHKIIFQVLKGVYKNDKPADIHLIAEELKRQSKLDTIGGLAYLTTLAQYVGTSAFIEEYVDLVKNKSTLRSIYEASNSIQQAALNEPNDIAVFVQDCKRKLEKIGEKNNKSSFDYLLQNNSEYEIINEIKNTSPGVTTGFTIGNESVKIPGGAISLVVLPTSHGKTSTLINFSLGVLNFHHDKSVYFFTYEESGSSILTLFLNAYIGKELSKNNLESLKSHFYKGNVEHIKAEMRNQFLSDKQLFFDHLINKGRLKVFYSEMSAEQLVEAIYFIKENTNAGLICIDYMQLLKSSKSLQRSRQDELKEICFMLKNCAVKTGLPILLGAQFNRSVVGEDHLYPTNIGEAGDIERIANLIIGGWNRNFQGFSNKGNIGKDGKSVDKESAIYFEIMKGRGIEHGQNSVLDYSGNTRKITNRMFNQSNTTRQIKLSKSHNYP